MINDGPGTGLITDCLLSVDGEDFKKATTSGWKEIHLKLGLSDPNPFMCLAFTDIHQGISPGNTMWLLFARRDGLSPEDQVLLRQVLIRLEVHLHYESLYGDKKTAEFLLLDDAIDFPSITEFP